MSLPAVCGGSPVFPENLSIVRPSLPRLETIRERLDEALASGQLTNNSKYVRGFSEAAARHLGVPHAVMVSNGTMGLILALAGLGLKGEVILPSFTFSATAHAVRWNGLTPVFVDILPDTFTLDPAAVAAAVTPDTAAIIGVHVYGHPCEIDELKGVATQHGIPLIFDAAHAFGSRYRSMLIGRFGDAEVFSFHATKVFPVGEGGSVTTSNATLAEYVELGCKFGDSGDENTRFPGLNAKMQEFNALVGLEMLEGVDRHIENRRKYAAYLTQHLSVLPGISLQSVRPYVHHNYQNFAVLIDEEIAGLSRDQMHAALVAENISTRKYFHPPLHRHDAYADCASVHLPVTEQVANDVLCIPFYSEMSQDMLEGLCVAIKRIQEHSGAVRRCLTAHSK